MNYQLKDCYFLLNPSRMGINEVNLSTLSKVIDFLKLNKAELTVTEIGAQQIQIPGHPLCFQFYRDLFGNQFKTFISLDLQGPSFVKKTDLSVILEEKEIVKSDLLINFGTSEHVEYQQGQYNCWKNMHSMLKVGGVAYHQLPRMNSFPDHCRYFVDETFFNTVARLCGYRIHEIGTSWDAPSKGWHSDCILIKEKDTEFLSYEEFWNVMHFIPGPVPQGENNPKNLN